MGPDAWQTGERAGAEFQWRWCDCDEWVVDDAEVAVEPGTHHVRERVPQTDVEVCYYVDEASRSITILRIRTMK